MSRLKATVTVIAIFFFTSGLAKNHIDIVVDDSFPNENKISSDPSNSVVNDEKKIKMADNGQSLNSKFFKNVRKIGNDVDNRKNGFRTVREMDDDDEPNILCPVSRFGTSSAPSKNPEETNEEVANESDRTKEENPDEHPSEEKDPNFPDDSKIDESYEEDEEEYSGDYPIEEENPNPSVQTANDSGNGESPEEKIETNEDEKEVEAEVTKKYDVEINEPEEENSNSSAETPNNFDNHGSSDENNDDEKNKTDENKKQFEIPDMKKVAGEIVAPDTDIEEENKPKVSDENKNDLKNKLHSAEKYVPRKQQTSEEERQQKLFVSQENSLSACMGFGDDVVVRILVNGAKSCVKEKSNTNFGESSKNMDQPFMIDTRHSESRRPSLSSKSNAEYMNNKFTNEFDNYDNAESKFLEESDEREVDGINYDDYTIDNKNRRFEGYERKNDEFDYYENPSIPLTSDMTF